tara:strand:+ start:1222 stop:1440 length:219 start_codon:yes stop_codon:yes gene_type:complete
MKKYYLVKILKAEFDEATEKNFIHVSANSEEEAIERLSQDSRFKKLAQDSGFKISDLKNNIFSCIDCYSKGG